MAGGARGPKQKLTRRSFLQGLGCGLVSSTLAGGYADYSAKDIRLERVELKLRRWKADGLRVGFISDVHVNNAQEMERARQAAMILAETSPHVLLFGGDCVNSNLPSGLKHISACLEPFRHLRCPKLAVLGNHDYASKAVGQIEDHLSRSGFLVLKNETARMDGYLVAGYDDQIWGRRDPDYQPNEPGTIALLHEPDFVTVVPATVSLQLSGHSHGGQMCLPFGHPLYTPFGALRYRRGFYRDAPVPLYVSRGVGTTGFKWRLFCPPEVTLLTLRSA